VRKQQFPQKAVHKTTSQSFRQNSNGIIVGEDADFLQFHIYLIA